MFAELAELCSSPGYAEAIASLCIRDNLILFTELGLTGEDLMKTFSIDRLVRTEISTLIGLMVRQPWDPTPPDAETLNAYVSRTEALLRELHDILSAGWFEGLTPEKVQAGFNPFERASALREPIFYGGESAYIFQYHDMAVAKYGRDDAWMESNRGFTVDSARRVVHAIGRLLTDKATAQFDQRKKQVIAPYLPAHAFSVEEVAKYAGLSRDVVGHVLDAFAWPTEDRNDTFNSLQDFNGTNARPLLRLPSGQFLLFQIYSLAEALYESPFYWMAGDKAYAPTATANRGAFAESFSRDCLVRSFGKASVHTNVVLPARKGARRGEIDVLVLFGDRAIVLQAKSKRLNIEARKGNDLQLQDDFKKAVQDASDQAMDCAQALLEPGCRLEDAEGKPILIAEPPKRVFPICVVSDHYPALAFQARQFLKHTKVGGVAAPIITDLFALDVITEMLGSPLRLLSYLDLRERAGDRLLMSGELTVLAYHLRKNLWLDEKYDLVHLGDDFCAALDAAMMVRREGLTGARTPEGILTRFRGTPFEVLIAMIEAEPNPAALDLGLLLLQLGEDTADNISKVLQELPQVARRDRRPHDVSFAIGDTGVTFHANDLDASAGKERLRAHCSLRKYDCKAERWFGVGLEPNSGAIRYIAKLEGAWEQDETMERLVADLRPAQKIRGRMPPLGGPKVGRNDLCPCGSGRKFKKCCLRSA